MRWANAWINALNSHRVEHIAPLLGETGTYEDASSGGPHSGFAVLLGFVGQWHWFPTLHFELTQVTGDAQAVVVEWRASGYGPAQASPRLGVFVIRLRHDSIASVRAY